MAPDPKAFHGSYTSRAKDCNHVIHFSVPSALEIKLSRPADTYSEPLDWEDEYPPVHFECVSANTLLCPKCQEEMYAERGRAARSYARQLWRATSDIDEDGLRMDSRKCKGAAHRDRVAALRVANFEGRMADRVNTTSQTEAKATREQKWEARRGVTFTVTEDRDPGEKKRAEKAPILLGPPMDSAISLPVRTKEELCRSDLTPCCFPFLSVIWTRKRATGVVKSNVMKK